MTKKKRIQPAVVLNYCRKALLAFFLTLGGAFLLAELPASKPSRTAAESCGDKLKKLEANSEDAESPKRQTLTFTQDEVNSYLALVLCSKYDPSLKSLVMTFEEDRLKGVAEIDFDRMEESPKLAPKLLNLLFTGTHVLSVKGKLASGEGYARFILEQASFDNSTLPKALVEKIITMAGRSQKPPFDPMKPSEMPYNIRQAEVHAGYLVVHQ